MKFSIFPCVPCSYFGDKMQVESNGRNAGNIQQSDHAALFADAQKSQRTGTARAAAVVRYA